MKSGQDTTSPPPPLKLPPSPLTGLKERTGGVFVRGRTLALSPLPYRCDIIFLMPTFRIITFGCKVNQCDSAGMAQELTARGWSPTPPEAVPDLVLVNTCTVTKRADQQARQTIGRMAREHPGLPIWVTGCYAQRAPGTVAVLPGVQGVFGNQEKKGVAHILNNYLGNQSLEADSPSPLMTEGWGGGEILSSPSRSMQEPGVWQQVEEFSESPPFRSWHMQAIPGQTRARLKIQEGCSHRCALLQRDTTQLAQVELAAAAAAVAGDHHVPARAIAKPGAGQLDSGAEQPVPNHD